MAKITSNDEYARRMGLPIIFTILILLSKFISAVIIVI